MAGIIKIIIKYTHGKKVSNHPYFTSILKINHHADEHNSRAVARVVTKLVGAGRARPALTRKPTSSEEEKNEIRPAKKKKKS